MGSKQSSHLQQDRPESGGANKDEALEKSGILERDKEKYASDHAKKSEEQESGRGAGVAPASRN